MSKGLEGRHHTVPATASCRITAYSYSGQGSHPLRVRSGLIVPEFRRDGKPLYRVELRKLQLGGSCPHLALEQVLRMPADFWLGLQLDWDLWHAQRSVEAEAIAKLRPLQTA